jgi:hypothetical protein
MPEVDDVPPLSRGLGDVYLRFLALLLQEGLSVEPFFAGSLRHLLAVDEQPAGNLAQLLQFIADDFVDVVALAVDLLGQLLVAEVGEGLSWVELTIALELQLLGGDGIGSSIVGHLFNQIPAFVAVGLLF